MEAEYEDRTSEIGICSFYEDQTNANNWTTKQGHMEPFISQITNGWANLLSSLQMTYASMSILLISWEGTQ